MGSTKVNTGQYTTGETTQKVTPTAEETQMNQALMSQFKQYEPGQTELYKNAFSLGNKLLTSFGDKGGQQWNSLIGGISPEQSQSMINEQDRLLSAKFQQQGLYDSGTSQSGRMRSATDLANQNAQFNVGTLQNALNLALSGQAQVQQPALGQSNQLGQALAGLRSTTGTSQQQGLGYQRNPFQGANLGVFGTWGSNYCWVASEIYGGWDKEETCAVRYYIGNLAPLWFKNFYLEYGERIAKFIHNKPILKSTLKPLFNSFIRRAQCHFLAC